MAGLQFQKATRKQVRIKMLLKGPTGAGKTYGALLIADGLAPGKVALLDSEHDRSEYYADVVPFQRAAPESFHPKHYMAAIHAAVEAGFEVLIIDSLSHCWLDVLERKDAYDKANPRTNQWTNWALFGEEWNDLLRVILEAPIHIICTARSKMAHEQVEQNGRKQVVKLGLAPQLRENTEYEFAICFDVELTTDGRHPAQVSKDNTNLMSEPGKVWDLVDGTVPALIRKWLSTAKEIERPSAETLKAIDDALLLVPEQLQARARKRVTERKQRGLSEAEGLDMLAQIRSMAATAETPAPTPTRTAPPAPTPPPTPPSDFPIDDTPDDEHASQDETHARVATVETALATEVTINGTARALGTLKPRALSNLRAIIIERGGDHSLLPMIDLVIGHLTQVEADAAERAAAHKAGLENFLDGTATTHVPTVTAGVES